MTYRTMAFVDGFNLYHGLRDKHGRRYHWLDLRALVLSLLEPSQSLVHIFYFTAAVRDDPPAEQRQGTYLKALASLPQLTVIQGRFQQKSVRCFSCHDSWTTYEEKESDVNLAVTLVEHAARDSFDTALLLSADSDMCPAINAAKALKPGIRVVAAFPPRRNSEDVREAAYAAFRISDAKIRQSQFPDEVKLKDGKVLHRPQKWRK